MENETSTSIAEYFGEIANPRVEERCSGRAKRTIGRDSQPLYAPYDSKQK